ncbi:hypothetical protein [Streptomyces vietnamensis]|uniref:hypothetical protein n=1 Tax=Streptomyces vietnamensis TaxID=362257 RepID=UPI0006986B5D|nr:hypothetical protein [Streptomyces vietnamensis]
MTPTGSTHVGEQPAESCGEIRTGLAEVDGALALFVQRGDQLSKDIGELKHDVEVLKRNRRPLPVLGAVAGLGSLGVTVRPRRPRAGASDTEPARAVRPGLPE